MVAKQLKFICKQSQIEQAYFFYKSYQHFFLQVLLQKPFKKSVFVLTFLGKDRIYFPLKCLQEIIYPALFNVNFMRL